MFCGLKHLYSLNPFANVYCIIIKQIHLNNSNIIECGVNVYISNDLTCAFLSVRVQILNYIFVCQYNSSLLGYQKLLFVFRFNNN